MPIKLIWNINDIYEFRHPKDNQWYLGKIVNIDLIILILFIEILIAERIKEEWKVSIDNTSKSLRLSYDTQELSAYHKTINPITGED